MENKDEIIIINAYINNSEKEELLDKCIVQLLKLGKDIMIVSHTPIDKKIISKIHYYIYDHDNSFLPPHLADCLWFSDDYIYYQTNRYGFAKHSYSVWRSIQNAVSFAKVIGKKFFYHLHYDSYIDDKDLDVFDYVRKMVERNNKKGYAHKYPVYIRDGGESSFNGLYCAFFAFDVDFFLDKISPLVYSPEEYHSRNFFEDLGVEVATIQCYLYNMFKNCLNKIYISESDNEELKIFPNSKFNTVFVDDGRHIVDIVKDKNSGDIYFIMYNDYLCVRNYRIVFSRNGKVFHTEDKELDEKGYYYIHLYGEPFDIEVYFKNEKEWNLIYKDKSINFDVNEECNYVKIGNRI